MVPITASEHPIKSVTVFKSRKAEVVRVFQLNLKKGQNKVEIIRLPSVLDSHSVRVSGLRSTCRLFDVVCRVGKAPDYDDGSRRSLNDQIAQLLKDIETREKGMELLFKYGQTITGEHINPQQMTLFVESLVDQNKKTQAAISKIKEEITAVTLKIKKLDEQDSSQVGTNDGKVNIVVVADEDCTSELKLTYIVSNVEWYPTYELHAKTESGKPSPSVSLHYRARITQSTGENWDNTSLTLSTVSSDSVQDGIIPQLKAIKIQPTPLFGNMGRNNQDANSNSGFGKSAQAGQPQQQNSTQYGAFGATAKPQYFGFGGSNTGTGLFGSSSTTSAFGATSQPTQGGLFGSAPSAGGFFGSAPAPTYQQEISTAQTAPLPDEDFEEVEGPTIAEPKTIVSETPIAIAYSVHGESTIPSDGIQHQVSITVLPFQANISYITIPRINPRVFLQCLVVNSSEYRLLAGIVNVIMDDSYVSKTSIPDINMGDTFSCTLGGDASTKVTYSRIPRLIPYTGGPFSEVTSTTNYTTTITVHNKHNFPITDLIVRDVIPTSDDKQVQIVLRKPSGLATAKGGERIKVEGTDGSTVGWEKSVDGKGGEKEGKYEWKGRVESGAKASFVSEWEVKTPGGSSWTEVLNPETRFGQKA